MKISDLIKMCARNLFRRKVRTLLTVTGVIIGTCSIVVMVSIGVGLNQSNEADMASYTDLTAIDVYAQENSGRSGGNGSTKVAKLDDRALKQMEKLEHVVAVTPVMSLGGSFELRCGDYTTNWPEMVAIDLSKAELFGYEVTEGVMATGQELNAVMFGSELAYNFYNDETGEYPNYEYDEEGNIIGDPLVDPLTEKVTIVPFQETYGPDGMTSDKTYGKERELQVSGMLKGDWSRSGSVWGMVISLDLAKQLAQDFNDFNGTNDQATSYSSFKVKVDDVDNVGEVEDAIKADGYQTSSATEFREAMQKQARMIQLVLGGLGAIAMLVAALGITNTMIMSIYERTREIGVMKVLGCRLKDIRMMFLIEAGGIGLLGGVLGVILSYCLSFILNIVGASLLDTGGDTAFQLSVIPLWLVLLGMVFSVGVGLLAGFYPANRAVRISALSAIRQEN